MSRKVGLADRAGFLVIGNSAQVLCVMLAWAGLARLLTKTEFGEYRQAWLPYNLVFPLVVLGLPASVLYFLPRLEPEARRAFVRRTTLLLCALGAVLTLGLWAAAPAIAAAFHNGRMTVLIRLFAFYGVVTLPVSHLQQVLVANGRHGVAAWFTGLVAAFQAACAVGAAWLTGSVWWAVGATVASNVPAAAIGLALIESGTSGNGDKAVPSVAEHLRYSLPLALSTLAVNLGRQIGQLVVSLRYRASEFAVYAAGAFEVPVLGVFTASVITTLVPVFSEMSHQDRWAELMQVWHESIRRMSLLVFPLFVLLFVLADQLIVFLFSGSYARSALVFRLFLLLIPMRVTVYSSLLQAAGKTRALAIGAGCYIAVNALLGVLLVGPLGIIGPAVALVASQYGLAAYYLLEVGRVVKTGVRDIIPWRQVNGAFAVAAAVGALVYPLTRLGMHPALTLAVCGIVYFVVCVAALHRLGFIKEGDMSLVRRWVTLSVWTR